ncbi:hypothetical protein, partial [Paraprevotella clara]|uniref:hypothetical protein n=1 Tax=Paraprevotella clara TaxID=454154 RepID=UPI002675DA9D
SQSPLYKELTKVFQSYIKNARPRAMGCLFLTIHSFWTNGREIRVSYAKRKFQAFLRIGREPLKKRKNKIPV